MLAVPRSASVQAMATEMPAAVAWASRHGLSLEYDVEQLALWLALTGAGPHKGSAPERYVLRGRFDGYRGVAPEWTFVHPGTRAEIGPAAFPQPDPQRPPLGPNLFIDGSNGPLICAHFNRLAYASHGGVHGDWGETTGWLTHRPGQTYATSIGAMLDRIFRDVRYTVGRKATLPE